MVINLIREGIENRFISILTYENPYTRRVEPYILYYSSTGRILLDCYQLSGFSLSGVAIGWKRFALNNIFSFTLTPERFQIRPEYNPINRRRYVRIICRIQ